MARKQHEVTELTRQTVKLHALVGTPQEMICTVLGITSRTLRKHYRTELDTSLAEANSKVGGKLYNKAISGDTSAMIFWLKTRAGFREQEKQKEIKEDTSEIFAAAIAALVKKLPGA